MGNIVRASSVRESESWGFISHPFLNQVVEVQTALSPEEVLQVTQQVEQDLGRTEKSGRDAQGHPIYHDRTIDIDLLCTRVNTGKGRSSPCRIPILQNGILY